MGDKWITSAGEGREPWSWREVREIKKSTQWIIQGKHFPKTID